MSDTSSNNNEELVQIIKGLLGKASEDLLSDPTQTRYIRDVQVEFRDLLFRSTDPNITFLLYFVTLFIDEIFYNLVGDIVGLKSEVIDEVRVDVFGFLGESLSKLVGFLDKKDFDSMFGVYTALVEFYLGKVSELNRKAMDQFDIS